MSANNHQRSPIRLDLVPNDLLTPEDLFTLTGYEDPKFQAKVLKENNIFYLKVRRNEIRTTWYHVNNPIHLRVPHLAQADGGVGWNKSFQPRVDSVPKPDATDIASTLEAYNNQLWIDDMNNQNTLGVNTNMSPLQQSKHQKYWSTKQVCERFGYISSRTLSRWVESRGFPPSVTPEGEANLYSIDAILLWEENYFTQPSLA